MIIILIIIIQRCCLGVFVTIWNRASGSNVPMSVFQQVCTIWISPNSSRPPSLSSTFCSWFQFTILDGAFQWMGLRHMRSLTNSCTLVSRAMSFRIQSLQVWRKWTISKSDWRCFASCSKYSDGSVLWTPMVSSKLEKCFRDLPQQIHWVTKFNRTAKPASPHMGLRPKAMSRNSYQTSPKFSKYCNSVWLWYDILVQFGTITKYIKVQESKSTVVSLSLDSDIPTLAV